MLTPKFLEDLPEPVIALYHKLEMEILKDMARRISTYDYWIPAAEHQNKVLQAMGGSQEYVFEQMAAATGIKQEMIRSLFREAMVETVARDRAIYQEAGQSPPTINTSQRLQQVINVGLKQTDQAFVNLTRTTAKGAAEGLGQALDLAWLKIHSGAFDTNTVIRSTVKELAAAGVSTVDYATGAKSTLEVAVRRAIVTGVNQTALKTQWALADEMECDLVEVTAHAGARPEHALWQGGIYSRSGRSKKYPDFVSSTGYGTGAGLGGWNCRHSFYPYIDGTARIYTKKQLDEYNKKKYTYQGESLTAYEASQKQRYIERNIRRWKREYVSMEAAGLDTETSAIKIKEWEAKQKDFLKQTGLKRQTERELVGNWGKETAAKARSEARRYEKEQKNDILKMEIRAAGKLAKTAVIHLKPSSIDVDSLSFDDKHINEERSHKVTEQQAKRWIRDAKISVTVWNGRYERYYGQDGTVYVDLFTRRIRTAYSAEQYDEHTQKIMEVLLTNEIL